MTNQPNRKVLTVKKEKWVKQFKPGVIRGGALNYNAAVMARYEARLGALVKQMTSQTRRELEKLFKGDPARAEFGSQYPVGSGSVPTQDSGNTSSQSRIVVNQLKKKFQQLFNRKAKGLAEQMIRENDRASASAVHASLKQLSGGLSLKTKFITQPMETVMKAHVAENVSLIKSIPQQYFVQIEGSVMRSITTGNGLEELIPNIMKYYGMTKRRARLIATDQTRKVYSNLNFERMDKIGVQKFEWMHSGGGKEPRPLHEDMSGNIYSMNNLPVIDDKTGERGIPGQLINCRCVALPVIEFAGEGEE